MSNIRQYIGARYVFKIYENTTDPSSAEWQSGVTYEPLTIVTYLNSTYASKKDVPASVGDPASNPSYWVVTGAYNGQIATLQNQIDAINNTDLPNINAAIQALTIKVNTNQNSKNTVVLFGDSWFANSTIGIAAYIQAHYNCNLKNYSVGGSGFNVQGGYKDQLNVMANDSTINLDDIKFVIISAGLNDHGRGATAAQFTTMFNEWKELFDNIFVGRELPSVYWFADYSLENELISSLPNGNPTDFYNQYRYYREVSRGIKNIKSTFGFGLVPGTPETWMTDNWRHPNAAGGILYAENICRIIDGVPPILYQYQKIVGTFRLYPSETITLDYFFDNGYLFCAITAKESVLANTSSAGLIVDFNHKLPASFITYSDIGAGCGVGIYHYNDDLMSIVQNNSSLPSLYSGSTGIVRTPHIELQQLSIQ